MRGDYSQTATNFLLRKTVHLRGCLRPMTVCGSYQFLRRTGGYDFCSITHSSSSSSSSPLPSPITLLFHTLANRTVQGCFVVSGAEPGRPGVTEARLSRVKGAVGGAQFRVLFFSEPFSLVHSRMRVYVGITGGIRERRFSPGGSSIGNGVLGGLRLREASE